MVDFVIWHPNTALEVAWQQQGEHPQTGITKPAVYQGSIPYPSSTRRKFVHDWLSLDARALLLHILLE
jgi:hypothetical protein